jgi:hypothetical protein
MRLAPPPLALAVVVASIGLWLAGRYHRRWGLGADLNRLVGEEVGDLLGVVVLQLVAGLLPGFVHWVVAVVLR